MAKCGKRQRYYRGIFVNSYFSIIGYPDILFSHTRLNHLMVHRNQQIVNSEYVDASCEDFPVPRME